MNEPVVTLDVREDLRQGREPFSRIMSAVGALGNDQTLRLLAPFEPAPLVRVLAARGFSHQARPTDSGDWEVVFSRGAAAAEAKPDVAEASPPAPGGLGNVEVDARGLEPPQPLVRILEALAALPAGATLRARTDRRPMHLYAQLQTRGFRGESTEQNDGSFVTQIRRA